MLHRKKRYLPLLWLVSLLAIGNLFAADEGNIAPRKDYTAAASALEELIQHELEDKGLPAISIALVDGNDIVWAQGFGFADRTQNIRASANTLYRVGSVSKLFTDIGIMQLVEQGKLDLDAPVQSYLKDFKPANQFSKPVTLRQLMSHRSGLLREPVTGHYFDDRRVTLSETVRSLNGRELIYEPEESVKYSNAGLAVVGYVLETVNRTPFNDYVKKSVLVPFGMASSSFTLEDASRRKLAKSFIWTYDGRTFPAPTFEPGMAPAANLYSTVLDLGRFMVALGNDGQGSTGPVLKPSTLAKMWEPQFGQSEFRGFGLGFMLGTLDGHRVVGHGGAVYGFATELGFLPDQKLGAVAVTTMDSANGVTKHVVQEALRLMLAVKNGQPLKTIPRSEPIPDELMARIAGRYGEGERAIELFQQRGELFLRRAAGGTQVRLRKLGDVLVTDDRLQWGLTISPSDSGVKIGNEALNASVAPKVGVAPPEFQGLVGEYGWPYNVLYITERNGILWSLIEWYEFEPLEQISRDVFRYPRRGLYDNEKLTFTRDSSGKATQVEVGGVVFKRRSLKPVRWDP